ncbi:MAG: hypothetical protein K2K09_00480 [Lachnospiraceae bacterium]|nr:hypothetical protein [Lachnospiraceae bacterium]
MKKEYIIPEVSIVLFEAEDIITTSGGLNDKVAGTDPDINFGDLLN